MNKNIIKWVFWILVASILFWGGFAFAISPEYSIKVKAICRFVMFLGIMIYASLIFTLVHKHLKQ